MLNPRLATVPLLALALVASGCATERDVIVKVPLSRLETPEPGPRRLNVSLARTGEAKAYLTRDQANVAPDTRNPTFSEDDDLMVRFDGRVQPWLQLSFRGVSNYGAVQAKFMPLQDAGPLSFAFTVGAGGSEDDFDYNDGGTAARTTVDSDLIDLAAILGWRFDPSLMVYGGPWFTEVNYSGHHFSDRGANPDVEFDYSGDLSVIGANLGLAASFRRWGRLLVEYSRATIDGGSTEADIGRVALSLEVFFGPLTEPD